MTYRAHGSDNTNGFMARDQGELGNELALVDVLCKSSAELRAASNHSAISIPDLEKCQPSLPSSHVPSAYRHTGAANTAGSDLDQDIVLAKLGQRDLDNGVVLGLLVAS